MKIREMEGLVVTMSEMISKQAVMETFVDILLCAVPIWLAVMIGLFIGWSWRPRWTGLIFLGLRSKLRYAWTLPPGFGARRLWFAFTALSAFSVCHRMWFSFRGRNRRKDASSSPLPPSSSLDVSLASVSLHAPFVVSNGDEIGGIFEVDKKVVSENDLGHLLSLLDGQDGEMAWQSLMERYTPNMAYQAWRHEPESGPTVYRSKTIFEDATPELVRDFFWDDEFRPKWDPMLSYFEVLEERPDNGSMIVHWIKKFPFFCSDREYVIGKRIWEAGKTFYCVTKVVPYPDLPRRDKPRRVDLYFSSWVVKPVRSLKGDGQLSACEVNLVHYEDMGIPKDVAKLGVRHGMWGTVKKLHNGFRAYQNARNSEASLSRCAQLANITTKLSSDETSDSLGTEDDRHRQEEKLYIQHKGGSNNGGGVDWRWVAVGGAVLICGVHTGLIGKALLLGAGQRAAARR